MPKLRDRVKNALTATPRTTQEIAEATGERLESVRRELNKLAKAGEAIKSGSRPVRYARRTTEPHSATPRTVEPAPEPQPSKALSSLPTDVTAMEALTAAEIRREAATARAIIAEVLPLVGLTLGQTHISIEFKRRFTARMGDARLRRIPGVDVLRGRLRFSASALWRRATPEKRRNTVIHELAHLLAENEVWPGRAGHGWVWKRKMIALGEKPVRCHTIDRTGLRRGSVSPPPRRVASSPSRAAPFQVGDSVAFDFKGKTLTGHVMRVNRRTCSIRVTGRPGYFRVSPGLLRKSA